MIDSPRFTEALARPMADTGGIAHVLLTHRDDVADADRYARRFGSRVWIHAADRSARSWASDIIDGDETTETTVAPGVRRGAGARAHPRQRDLPGRRDVGVHRRLAGVEPRPTTTSRRSEARAGTPGPTRPARCRPSPPATRFEWLLPGHGGRMRRPPDEMATRLVALVDRMGGDLMSAAGWRARRPTSVTGATDPAGRRG